MNIVIEADAQLCRRLRECHEGVPGRSALAGAWPEADIPFAHPGART